MEIINIDTLHTGCNKNKIIKPLFNNGFLSVEFLYKSDYENTKHLREFVEIICDIAGFSNKTKSRIILITDELNNNAIEYGSSKGAINALRVKIEKQDSNIILNLEVEDDGKGQKPKTALDMETMRAHKLKLGYFNHDSIRGRGLFLITVKIADRLYFKNSKNGGLIVGIKTKIKE